MLLPQKPLTNCLEIILRVKGTLNYANFQFNEESKSNIPKSNPNQRRAKWKSYILNLQEDANFDACELTLY